MNEETYIFRQDDHLFDYLSLGVFIIDRNYTVRVWNRRIEEWTGIPSDKIRGHTITDLFPKFSEDRIRKRLEGIFSGGPPVMFSPELHPDVFLAKTRGNRKRVQKTIVTALPNGNNEYLALFSLEDITEVSNRIVEYRSMRDQALKALEEKEFLIREVHHRVKNNLALVQSLISLKISQLGLYDEFDNLLHQIDAIVLLHEKLYRGDNITMIDFRVYTEELLETIFSTLTGQEICSSIRIPDVHFPIKTTLYLGLIMNEAATNFLKYGMPSDRAPEFRILVTLDEATGEYTLRIGNNGPSFPEDFSWEETETLGIQVLKAMTFQLNGTISLHKGPDPEYTITFLPETE